MWDWELLKNNSGKYHYHVACSYKDENIQYSRSISYGTGEDEFILHNHALYEMELYLNGDVVYTVDGVRYAIEPGSLLLIAPTVPHRLFINSDTTFERHIFYFSYIGNQSPASVMLKQCFPSIEGKRVGSIYYSPQQVRDILPIAEEVSKCADSGNKILNDLVPAFTQAILAKLIIKVNEQEPVLFSIGEDRTMDAVKNYLIDNMKENLSLQEIADHFHLSKDYCNRLFHKVTGMSIIQFVKYNRVLMARQLLADGIPATEAARQVGFEDYSNFYRAYKMTTGRTPSEDYQIADSNAIFIPSSKTDIENAILQIKSL